MAKNFIKLLFLSFVLFTSNVELYAESNNMKVARQIAESDGTETLKDSDIKLRDVIKAAKDARRENATIRAQLCETKNTTMISGSTLVKKISPLIYFLIVILSLLAIKKLFIDNPDNQKNGITSNVLGGGLYIFFAALLSQFRGIIDWWDNTIIPEFNHMCEGGEENALRVVIMKNVLFIIFVIVQLVGVIIMVMGLVDIVKKDRSGKVSPYSIGTKLIGGALLINYRLVLKWFGVLS